MSKPGKKNRKGHRQFQPPKMGPVEFEMVDIGFGRKELSLKQMIGGVQVTTTSADGFAHRPKKTDEFIVIGVSRNEVETLNTNSALERLYVLTDSKENVMLYREKVQMQFDGYDFDPRELPQIPAVCAYFKKLVQDWPHWVWFACRGTGTIGLLFSMLCEVELIEGSKTKGPFGCFGSYGTYIKDKNELAHVLTDMLMRSSALFEAYQIDIEATEQSTETALRELGY